MTMRIEGFDNLIYLVGQMNGNLTAINEKLENVTESIDGHDRRIKLIEEKESKRTGAMMTLVGFAGCFGGLVGVIASIVTIREYIGYLK